MAEKLLNISGVKWVKISAAGSIFFVAAMFIYFPNYARLRKIKEENKKLIVENKSLEKEIIDYQSKIKRVGKDSSLYEEIAREDLGVAKEGEIVIDIIR